MLVKIKNCIIGIYPFNIFKKCNIPLSISIKNKAQRLTTLGFLLIFNILDHCCH